MIRLRRGHIWAVVVLAALSGVLVWISSSEKRRIALLEGGRSTLLQGHRLLGVSIGMSSVRAEEILTQHRLKRIDAPGSTNGIPLPGYPCGHLAPRADEQVWHFLETDQNNIFGGAACLVVVNGTVTAMEAEYRLDTP